MGIFGKPSHIPSQRKGLVGFLQDAIHISSLQSKDKTKKPNEPGEAAPGVSPSNQRKLDLVDHYDNLAGESLARGDKKMWEQYSKKAQKVDDSID